VTLNNGRRKSAYLGGGRERHPLGGQKVREMIFGEFHQQTDEKGRVRIPSKIRPLLSDGVIITKGSHGCLFLFPASEWDGQLAQKLSAVPLSDLDIQKSLRLFFSSASELENDNQGRSLLPKNLREFANIKKDIVFIGVGNRAELWAKEEYDAYFSGKIQKKSTNFDELLAELKRYGI
jgi:MraZ protein